MIFKGLGMGMLFIGIWFYASLGMTMEKLMSTIGILMVVRSW